MGTQPAWHWHLALGVCPGARPAVVPPAAEGASLPLVYSALHTHMARGSNYAGFVERAVPVPVPIVPVLSQSPGCRPGNLQGSSCTRTRRELLRRGQAEMGPADHGTSMASVLRALEPPAGGKEAQEQRPEAAPKASWVPECPGGPQDAGDSRNWDRPLDSAGHSHGHCPLATASNEFSLPPTHPPATRHCGLSRVERLGFLISARPKKEILPFVQHWDLNLGFALPMRLTTQAAPPARLGFR